MRMFVGTVNSGNTKSLNYALNGALQLANNGSGKCNTEK